MTVPPIPPWIIGGLAAALFAALVWRLAGLPSIFNYLHATIVARAMSSADGPKREPVGIEAELLAAGLAWPPRVFQAGRIVVVLLVVMISIGLRIPPLLLVLCGLAAVLLPRWYLRERIRRRALALEQELATAYARLAGLIKLQPSIAELLALVARSLLIARPDSALGQELLRLSADVHQREGAALRDLERRTESPGLRTLAFSLRAFMESGTGDYADALSDSARRTRAILESRAKGAAKAGSARLASRMFPLLLLGVFLFALQDPQYRAFYATGAGQLLLAVVIGLMGWGYRFIGRAIEEVG